jgi:hypothetical protein
MTPIKPHWKPHAAAPAGQGVAIQQFVATVGSARLEIAVAGQGDGTLKVNGVQIARIQSAGGGRQALRDLKRIAARHLRRRAAVPTAH